MVSVLWASCATVHARLCLASLAWHHVYESCSYCCNNGGPFILIAGLHLTALFPNYPLLEWWPFCLSIASQKCIIWIGEILKHWHIWKEHWKWVYTDIENKSQGAFRLFQSLTWFSFAVFLEEMWKLYSDEHHYYMEETWGQENGRGPPVAGRTSPSKMHSGNSTCMQVSGKPSGHQNYSVCVPEQLGCLLQPLLTSL